MADHSLQYYDLDTGTGFQNALSKLSNYTTHNFIVDFDAESAVCAADLSSDQILNSSRAENGTAPPSCRWLNTWSCNPEERASIRGVLASYGVSPRLTHLLSPDLASEGDVRNTKNLASNLEKFSEERGQENPIPRSKAAILSMSNIPEDLWHFCSIDWGRRFVCISFNALFTTANPGDEISSRRPDAIRVWSAIVLCDDGTVLSVFETPSGLPVEEVRMLRKNQINVFKNLSRQYDPLQSEANLFQVDLRPLKSATVPKPGSEAHDCFDMASRLFYYIFDDWRATFELVSGRHHPYRQKLDDVRAKMAKAPAVDDVERLHRIGQQLVTLKRVYQGYEKLLDRLLQRERHLSTLMWRTAQRTQSSPSLLTRQWSSGPEVTTWVTEADGDQKTIKLPLGTVARFERLLDRIRLYALAEIEECLAEKESLVLMTFNLVNLKTATVIERLTRTTILLAKVTILFLPVSLMTGYFGTSLSAINRIYSIKVYWVCFVVVTALTMLLLLSLNLANNRVTGKIVYQSLTGILWQGARNKSHEARGGRMKDV